MQSGVDKPKGCQGDPTDRSMLDAKAEENSPPCRNDGRAKQHRGLEPIAQSFQEPAARAEQRRPPETRESAPECRPQKEGKTTAYLAREVPSLTRFRHDTVLASMGAGHGTISNRARQACNDCRIFTAHMRSGSGCRCLQDACALCGAYVQHVDQSMQNRVIEPMGTGIVDRLGSQGR